VISNTDDAKLLQAVDVDSGLSECNVYV